MKALLFRFLLTPLWQYKKEVAALLIMALATKHLLTSFVQVLEGMTNEDWLQASFGFMKMGLAGLAGLRASTLGK